MNVSQTGIDLIKRFESCRLHSYHDSVGVLTIGWGHTGGDVSNGLQISQDDADDFLEKDLKKFNDSVSRLLTAEVNQGQFDALVCFAYNVGLGNLKTSTLLRKVNACDPSAADEFQKWTHAGGKVLPGLITRRKAEAALFRGDS
jgi:lysozyme